MKKRRLAFAIGLICMAASAVASTPRTQPAPTPRHPPNILIIVLDTLRYDATSLGRPGGDTPFLASLLPGSVLFTNAYSTHDFTPTSHFSLLTGLRDGLGTVDDRPGLSVAFQVQRAGYDTFATAANALLSPKAMPILQSFDRFTDAGRSVQATLPDYMNDFTAIDMRLAMFGFRHTRHNRESVYFMAGRVLPTFYEQIVKAKPPFLGFLNLLDSHEPYVPDPEIYPPEREKLPQDFDPDILARPISDELKHPERIADPARRRYVEDLLKVAPAPAFVAADLSPAARTIYRNRYQAKVRRLDERLQDFFARLAKAGILNDTFVIITSDHGESFGEAGLMMHDFHDAGDFESTHHVPMLIVVPPGYAVRERIVTRRVSIASIPATIYDLIGLDAAAIREQYGERFAPSLAPAIGYHPIYASRAMLPTGDKHDNEAAEREREAQMRALGYLQ